MDLRSSLDQDESVGASEQTFTDASQREELLSLHSPADLSEFDKARETDVGEDPSRGPDEAPVYEERGSTLALKRRNLWAKKARAHNKYQHQDNNDPRWFRHDKHILIFSWSGRPIYSRYGDETKMAAYMGLISLFISNFEGMGDSVRAIVAGNHRVVFLFKGPIYLVCIASTDESIDQLRTHLEFAHAQILSVLTVGIHQTLETSPNYDIRNLLAGTEHLLSDLMTECGRSPAFHFDAVSPLRIAPKHRGKVAAAFRRGKSKNLVFALLLAGNRVVCAHREAKLTTQDLLLLINFVTNSQSLRASESWAPICLPDAFDGHLFAYVCFLSDGVALTLVTKAATEFHVQREHKEAILQALGKGSLDAISRAKDKQDWPVEWVGASPELRHFVYKSCGQQQFVAPAAAPPFHTKRAQRELFAQYMQLFTRAQTRAKSPRKHSVYFELMDHAALLAWIRPNEFELYATFTPLVSKEAVIVACNKITRWVEKDRAHLFF